MTRRLTAALLALTLLAVLAPVTQAAGGTFYVDGKTGSDGNGGRSTTDAFKTIYHAAAMLPAGSLAAGWTVSVKGYTDFVYRERAIPPGWDRRGTSAARIVFQATGYVSGPSTSYVKPIVSGADIVPTSGKVWTASSTANVWKTPLATAPFGFGTFSGSLRGALFQNTTTWLWEQSSLSALAVRAKAGKGGFWYDKSAKQLYVSGLGSPSTGGTNPSKYRIEVVLRSAFLFMGTNGVAYVDVRGFDVRHSANGIAFIKGADYGTIVDNVLTGNLLMGIATSGGQTANGPNPATGMNVARNKGTYNTLQMIKIDEGTQNSTFCDNTAAHNGLQGIKVQGPPGYTSYTGTTSGITICRNTLAYNNYNPTGSIYNNASGLTIANGARNVIVDSNKIFHNDVGIHVTQEATGRAKMDGIALKRNDVHENRRFGLNLYDGSQGASSGAGTLRSDYDVYWKNGIGVMASRGTSNKAVYHATIFDNKGDGVRVGESGTAKATFKLSTSIVTHNDGYGVWLVTGNSASLSYVNFSSNTLGTTKGAPSKTAINTQAPGYFSTTVGNSAFLKIKTTSYQYTAGPSKTAIGARY
jgi:hypothetical protein